MINVRIIVKQTIQPPIGITFYSGAEIVSSILTPEEERRVAGTPDQPAACLKCGAYSVVFNVCDQCGRDERPRHGCEHRIGKSGICDQCRKTDLQKQAAAYRDGLAQNGPDLEDLLSLFFGFLNLKLANNREALLSLQVRGSELLEKVARLQEQEAKQ